MRSAEALGKALSVKLTDIFQEHGPFSIEEIRSDDGLKSNLLTDPIFSVEITSDNSFRVTANPKDISRAILRDYYYGYCRVKSQWASTTTLAAKKGVAWTLVSAYYCSFFGAIEALRVCGTHLLSLSSDEAKSLFSKCGGPHLDAILTKKNFRGVISSDMSTIGYTHHGEKPHATAWIEMQRSVLDIVPSKVSSWEEIAKFRLMCKGKNGWEAPSDIRNRWNYRDSNYYGSLGDSAASPFLNLIRDSGAASAWIRGQSSVRSEADSAASIAILAQFIQGAIQGSFDFGFTGNLK